MVLEDGHCNAEVRISKARQPVLRLPNNLRSRIEKRGA